MQRYAEAVNCGAGIGRRAAELYVAWGTLPDYAPAFLLSRYEGRNTGKLLPIGM